MRLLTKQYYASNKLKLTRTQINLEIMWHNLIILGLNEMIFVIFTCSIKFFSSPIGIRLVIFSLRVSGLITSLLSFLAALLHSYAE